jgi:predicted N-acetyltransferase YhbS
MTSPADYTMRLYQGEADYAGMRALLQASYPLTVPPLNPTVGDLDWWRATTNDPQVLDKVRLWFDQSETVVAGTWPSKSQVEVLIDPHHRVLEPAILAQAEADYRGALQAETVSGPFSYWSLESDPLRNALLTEQGYTRTDAYLALHTFPLPQALSAPALPPGYTIRQVRDESDLEARVNAHRAAFHPSRMTVEKHRAVRATPTYRSELDLVVVTPEGEFAAYTIVWWDEVNAMGIFEPVGCPPDYQRRGLARAVMTEGLHRLQALGARVAHVNSWREDSAGAGLYRAIGFEVLGRIFEWTKTL